MAGATRKIRKTFTLTRESLALLSEVEKEKHAPSASAALDELLLEKRREREQARHEAAMVSYYDARSDAQMEEDANWGEISESQFPLE